jgi:hypothetical protein
MTATTSNLDTRRRQDPVARARRIALAVGSLLAAIAARWNAVVEAGQLGPVAERSISRHAGGRT